MNRKIDLIKGLFFTAVVAVHVQAAEPVSGQKTVKPESVGLSGKRLQRIDTVMQKYIDEQLVAGTVTLVARRGKVVHLKAQGLRDVAAGAAMTTDTIFRIASMTKPITSVALMMLYEEGHFQLHDPVAKWLPEFSDMQVAVPSGAAQVGTPLRLVPADKPISVRHMLTHTAGLSSSYRSLNLSEYREATRAAGPRRVLADSVKLLATLPLNYQPGERWEYSSATNVVARLVEVMSGLTLDEFFKQRIFQPLGMKDTHFYLPEEKVHRLAAQYTPSPDGQGIALQDPASKQSRFVKEPHTFFSGTGGLLSTAADYARFQQMMLNRGRMDGVRILGRKTVELMLKNHTGDLPIWLRGPGNGFGLGYSIMLDSGQAGSMVSEGSASWGGAYCTVFWIDPREQLLGILMTQVRPYNHLNIRADFQSLVNQAIID